MESFILPPKEHTLSCLPPHFTGVMEINTRAIMQNYKTLQSRLSRASCAAVLKADAYGFGMKDIAPLLLQVGCQHFFVAHLEEGLTLRPYAPQGAVYVLSGLLKGTEDLFREKKLIPVLNTFDMVERWSHEARTQRKKLPCVLHVDTGMHRNGFDQEDVKKLLASLSLLETLDVKCIMSHLASSQDPQDPLNEHQQHLFNVFLKHFPHAKASLADTAGIYLDPSFHYHIARAGKGLFGLYTPPFPAPPLLPCLRVAARILQLRTAYKGESVGYGASHILTRDSQLATLGIGFADGYDRRLSHHAHVDIQGHKAPVVGRISMDYTVIDVTEVPESLYHEGGWVDLVNDTLPLDSLAQTASTISRELSTRLGSRLYRVYG